MTNDLDDRNLKYTEISGSDTDISNIVDTLGNLDSMFLSYIR